MRAVRVARDDFRQLPPHLGRSQRRWSLSSPRSATRCTPRWTGAAGLVHGSPPRAACHSRSRLPHPRAPVPAVERSRWPLPPPRCGSHGQPHNDYTVIPRVQIRPLKRQQLRAVLGATLMCTPSVIPRHAPDAAAVAEACAPCTDKSCGLPASRCFQKIVAPLRSPRARIPWSKGCRRSIGRHRHLCSIHSRQQVHASCRRVREKPEAWSTRVCHTPKAGFAPSTLKSCPRVVSLNNAGT